MERQGGMAPRHRGGLDKDGLERALAQLGEAPGPAGGSLVRLRERRHRIPREPFRPGFLSGIEERAEVVRRLRALEPRERLLLYLWYAEGRAVTEIAGRLGVSRVHCYRLRDRALAALAAAGLDDEPAAI